MVPTVVRDYERPYGGPHVEKVTIIPTDADADPSGWNSSLYSGEIGGRTLLRHDNAPNRETGHECHPPDGTETIEFPGMEVLYRRFRREIATLPPGDTA